MNEKMNRVPGAPQTFESTLILAPGEYLYYYRVDGDRRYNLDEPSITLEDETIFNSLSLQEQNVNMESDMHYHHCLASDCCNSWLSPSSSSIGSPAFDVFPHSTELATMTTT
mmetsp:Transcript_6644/g.4983  ORF Transcript_6644/g.4983 Transcript_6644/m.4983 type:complete len:112 (-) Transcript_6644:592-927(-)